MKTKNKYMLTDVYYIIKDKGNMCNHYEYLIELNPDSEIFKLRFDVNPMSPGACNVKLVTECVSEIIGRKAEFETIDRCRFFSIIKPDEKRSLIIDVSLSPIGEDKYTVSAEIADDENVVVELSGRMMAKVEMACS